MARISFNGGKLWYDHRYAEDAAHIIAKNNYYEKIYDQMEHALAYQVICENKPLVYEEFLLGYLQLSDRDIIIEEGTDDD